MDEWMDGGLKSKILELFLSRRSLLRRVQLEAPYQFTSLVKTQNLTEKHQILLSRCPSSTIELKI